MMASMKVNKLKFDEKSEEFAVYVYDLQRFLWTCLTCFPKFGPDPDR